MKHPKRLLSIFLAALLVLGMFGISAGAAEEALYPIKRAEVSIGSSIRIVETEHSNGYVAPGTIVTIEI